MVSEEEKDGKLPEEETVKIRKVLKDIEENLIEELEDLHEDFKNEVEDIKDETEDLKGEFKDELEEIKEEKESLLEEIKEIKEKLGDLGEAAKDRIESLKDKYENHAEKAEKHAKKFEEKVRKKVEKATKKAEEKAKRINISVDPEMSEEWRDWADNLGASVSELVRKSMKFVKNNIGDIRKLERWGKKMDKIGGSIEKTVKNSGIEELGERFEKQFGKNKGKAEIKMAIIQESDKERIKKRVNGLIKLHKSLPIDKLAQALNKSDEDAENLVYELVADGIEGILEEGVFKFTSTSEEVISKLNDLIEKM